MDATALKLRAAPPRPDPASDEPAMPSFRNIFDALPVAIALCGLDGRIREASAAFAELLGVERDELPSIDLREFAGGMPLPGKSPLAKSVLPDLAALAKIAELPGCTFQPFVVESEWQRRDGSTFWGQLTATFARDGQGRRAGLLIVLEDLSATRQIEERLHQAERMEIVGRLASGVAHDFNNLLTGIFLYSDLLLADLTPDSLPHRRVEEIRQASEQGRALTQQLLSVARKNGAEPQMLGINRIVAGTENLLRCLVGERIELSVFLDPAADAIAFDAAPVRQVLLNLALNARDALGGGKTPGGKIRVSTDFVTAAQNFSAEPYGGESYSHDLRPTDLGLGNARLACRLTVEDSGCGMDHATLGHMFEPFFSTKKPGEGTGLGLATVQRIVGESGGAINVVSSPGLGTCIEILLPKNEVSCTGAPKPPGSVANAYPIGNEVSYNAVNSQFTHSRSAHTPK